MQGDELALEELALGFGVKDGSQDHAAKAIHGILREKKVLTSFDYMN